MDYVALATLGSGIAGALSSLWSSYKTTGTNVRQAEKNLAFQREQYQYQKELNALQMQREDSAVQRGVADAMSAGLSPLSASSAVSGDLSSTQLAGTSPNVADFSSPVASALSAMSAVQSMYNSKRQTDSNIATNESQQILNNANAQNAAAEADKNREQALTFKLDNALSSATFEDNVQKIRNANDLVKSQISKLNADKSLTDKQKEYLGSQLKELDIKLKTYADYMQESLNNIRYQNDNIRTQGDIFKLQRAFQSFTNANAGTDKMIEWRSKAPNFEKMLTGLMQTGIFPKTGDNDWFWDSKK